MTTLAKVFRWRLWKRDPTHEEGLTFLAAAPGERFPDSDTFAAWARGRVTDQVTDLVVLAFGTDHRGRTVKVRTDHPASLPANAAAA